jgi:hypothetical protein
VEYGFGETRPRSDWTDFLAGKRREVAARMQDLKRMDRLLAQFADCACPSLEDCMGRANCLDDTGKEMAR